MKVWNEISWVAMYRRAREIEATFWQWSPGPNDFSKNDVVADVTQADYVDALALMVWCDDGGTPDELSR